MTTLIALLVIFLTTAVLGLVLSKSRLKFQESQAHRLQQRGQIRESISLLRTVVDANPRNASARWFLVHCLERFGDDDAALSYAGPFLARWTNVGEIAPLDLPPETTIEQFAETISTAYVGLSRLTEALDLLRLLRRSADVANAPAIGKLHAEISARCGESAEAIESYRLLERLDALDPVSAFAFGRLLARQGPAEEAVPRLEKAAAALPERQDIAEALAEVYTAVGRHHDAWPILKHLYLQAHGRDRVRFGRKYAVNLEDVGAIKEAIEILGEVAELPETPPDDAADLLCRAGDILQKIEKPTEALKRWSRAVELAPEHDGACRRLGIAVRPGTTHQFIRYIRNLSPEAYQKLFASILTDWGYTVERAEMPNPESLHLTVARIENGKERKKLVYVKRWENEVGQFPIQDLKLEVHGRKLDAGVFITMSHYSAKALVFAARSRVIELFSATEIFALIEHLELPR